MHIISLKLLSILCLYALFAFAVIRHKFFLGSLARFAICFVVQIGFVLALIYLPDGDANTVLTAKKHLGPISSAFGFVMLLIIAFKIFSGWHNYSAGKDTRDYLERRR